MSKATLEESEKKYPHIFQEEENDDDFNEHYDIESEKNKIVEYSPKGRFVRFNEELGSGAYKTVYKAYDNETGWEVAWNIIKLQRLPDKERRRISDEIALLKQLKHPNIIHFISAWINRQREEVVFITEVVTGGSLKRYMKKIKVPRLKVIKTWCREILQGIDYLHNLEPHPIIHRDIKCDNIFINSNKGEIRIGDLGLATFMSHAYADSVLGTPEFMAPEMYEEVYGPSVDIYSFGMCVLEMVTNETPYKECMNPAQIYRRVSKGIKPCSLNQIANEEVRSFIDECLKPKDERPSATELLKSEFLNTVDPELDNQPVQLYDTPQVPKIDEEESLKGSMKANEKMTKLYQQALEEGSGSEKEADEIKSDQNEERGQEERKAELQGNNAETDASYELKKKAVSEKIAFDSQVEKAHLMNIPRGQSFQMNQGAGVQNYLKEPEEAKREYLSQKSQEVAPKHIQEQNLKLEEKKLQSEQAKDSHEIERYKSDPTGKMPDFIRRQKENQRSSTQTQLHAHHDDDAKSIDLKRASDDIIPQPIIFNRESHRYHFVSKGIVNNYLVISIRYDQYEHETIIEIHKDKIYPDKIMKKLFKHLEITNPSDHYFSLQFNALIDALIAQNILQNPNPMFGSSALAKSVTNESQRSPDRSVLTTNQNSVYFQPKNFNKFYKKYLSEIPKEYLMLETEEAMNLRHQREIMELENNHLAQKRNLWDRRQNIMSNNSYNGVVYNGFQVTTLDTDDFYHKLFHLNEISYRSEIKKKGSRGTEFSISSVDSATLSPTCSSGNNIHSISNWTDINIPVPKKEEIPTNMLEEISKLAVQVSEVPSDTEKLSSNVILDQSHQTPKSQASLQHQFPINSTATIISPKAGSTPMIGGKHQVSNFAMHAMKPNVIKTQSDKSGQKEKRTSDASEKDMVDLPQKRSSIEKTPEAANQLAQTLLQSTPVSHTTTQHTTPTHNNPHSQNETEKTIMVEQKKEMIYEKLTINTNNSSPAEKGSQASHHNESTKVGPIKVFPQNSQPAENKKSIQTHLNILVNNPVNVMQGTSTPTNAMQNDPSRPGNRNTASNTPRQSQNMTIAQTLPIQPNSATIKSSNGPSNQQPVLAQNSNINKQAATQSVQTNPLAQKLTLSASQNSAGNLQTKPNQQVFTFPSNKSAKNLTGGTDQQNKSFSQSTYQKLQSTELIEKIKNYKIKGAMKRNDSSTNPEDVKMLQTCLELLTDNDILLNGNFNHYTENLLKSCQESLGLVPDGIVDEIVWEKIIYGLEKKIEKKKIAKDNKIKEAGESGKDKDDLKKKIKDKQNKEASECLTKIESNLVDLSDLK